MTSIAWLYMGDAASGCSRRRLATRWPVIGGALWSLVKALALLPCMGSSQDRNFVVRLLTDRLGLVPIEESPRSRQHILSIVEVCDRRSDGLPALLDIVRELDEGTAHLLAVERMIASRTALPLWPDDEREELCALLRREALNADPDGLPKPIVFVEHLARGRRSELAMELHRSADR